MKRRGFTNVGVVVRSSGGNELLTVPVLVPEHEEEEAALGLDGKSMLIGAALLSVLAAATYLALRFARRRPAVAAAAVAFASFVAFTPEHVDSAAQLLARRHAAHRRSEPLLDPAYENPETCANRPSTNSTRETAFSRISFN